ncbi:MAG: hypothetical protein Q4B81_00120 [Moraxella sp.]|nr:hypothetical protein [Moraxella sp.]
MKLSELTEKSTPIKEFVQRLAKSTKQRAISVVAHKAKRISGVSARPFDIHLENGQVVVVYVRTVNEKADIFRIDLNGKQMPTTGDFGTEYMPAFYQSVDEVAAFVVRGQQAFDKKRAKVKVKRPSAKPSQSMSARLEALATQSVELDAQITAKQSKVDELYAQIEQIKAGGGTVPDDVR